MKPSPFAMPFPTSGVSEALTLIPHAGTPAFTIHLHFISPYCTAFWHLKVLHYYKFLVSTSHTFSGMLEISEQMF